MNEKNEKTIEKISEKYSGFMRKAEQINSERVKKMVKTNRLNRTLGLMLATFVGSVYLYSMFAVKQEKFLDQIVDIKDIQDMDRTKQIGQ